MAVYNLRLGKNNQHTLRIGSSGRLAKFLFKLRKQYPKMRILRKKDHWYMRALGSRFVNRFSTVIGKTVWVSENLFQRAKAGKSGWEDSMWAMLRHESIHMAQFKRLSMPLMALIYVLLPLPLGLAYGRARFELDGYRETMRAWFEIRPGYVRSESFRLWWVSQFTTSKYLWMWPFRKTVTRWYFETLQELERDTKEQ